MQVQSLLKGHYLQIDGMLQDAAWREQQRRLLSAHFGPREVESLAMNSVLPLDRDDSSVAGAPLLWVQQREMKVSSGSPTQACTS